MTDIDVSSIGTMADEIVSLRAELEAVKSEKSSIHAEVQALCFVRDKQANAIAAATARAEEAEARIANAISIIDGKRIHILEALQGTGPYRPDNQEDGQGGFDDGVKYTKIT